MKSYRFITQQLALEAALIQAWSRGPADYDARALNEDGTLAVFAWSVEAYQQGLHRLLEADQQRRRQAKYDYVRARRRASGRRSFWPAPKAELVYSTGLEEPATETVVNEGVLEYGPY